MGFEKYTREKKKYDADVYRLNEISVAVSRSDLGSFLKAIADAWWKADPSDQRILKPAWEAFVVKYSLEEELRG